MSAINEIIDGLEAIPRILDSLLSQIPESIRKQRKGEGQWSIHEHAAHIADVMPMLQERLERFKNEEQPVFKPYIPGITDSVDDLYDTDLTEITANFSGQTERMVQLLRSFSPEDMQKKGVHPEYKMYTPYILMRHILMHAHLHMYRIEELWLTREEFQPG
jgi:uncharacterized damage-inducible protein DinB